MLPAIVEAYLNVMTGANKELALKRLDICKPCMFYNKTLGTCNCGCVMRAKATVKREKCPKSKW